MGQEPSAAPLRRPRWTIEGGNRQDTRDAAPSRPAKDPRPACMTQRTRESQGDPAASWRASVWSKAAEAERERSFRTPSGIELEPLYCHASDPGAADGDFPGCYPYTRGIHPTMYRGRL